MEQWLRIEDPVDAHGKIRPIADKRMVNHPVVAYIIALEDGMYVSIDHEMVRRESLSEAMGYIENKRRHS